MKMLPRREAVAVAVLILLAGMMACSREEPTPPPEPIAASKAANAEHKAKAEAKEKAAAEKKAQNQAAARPEPAAAPSGPPPFTVHVTSEDDLGEIPLSVKLDVTINEGGGTPPYTITWDFGDATPFSNDQSPTHVYEFPGEFRASVIVRDKNGKTAQDFADVIAEEPFESPQAVAPPADLGRKEALEKLKAMEREKAASKDEKAPGKE
jgi:PKD domain